MKTKRFMALGITGIFFISMMNKVLGTDYSTQAANTAQSFLSIVQGFFGSLLSPISQNTEIFNKLLMSLLLGMVVYSIIATIFKGSRWWIHWGITVPIVLLAMIGLPGTFLEVIRTEYGAMGATILTIIPFIIVIGFTIKTNNLVIAKLTWIFYAMYYFSMYAYTATIKGGFLTTESMPYGIAFFVGIFIFFWIKEIRSLLVRGEIDGLVEKGMEKVNRRASATNVNDANLTAQTGIDI